MGILGNPVQNILKSPTIKNQQYFYSSRKKFNSHNLDFSPQQALNSRNHYSSGPSYFPGSFTNIKQHEHSNQKQSWTSNDKIFHFGNPNSSLKEILSSLLYPRKISLELPK